MVSSHESRKATIIARVEPAVVFVVVWGCLFGFFWCECRGHTMFPSLLQNFIGMVLSKIITMVAHILWNNVCHNRSSRN